MKYFAELLVVVVTASLCEGVIEVSGNCDLTYDSKCFRIIVFPTAEITFDDAEMFCNMNNGMPGEIYDSIHQWFIQAYLSANFDSIMDQLELWTGMDISNDGSDSSYIHFDEFGGEYMTEIVSGKTPHKTNGVICQISL